ncbi:MAG: hypothetical protein ABL966_15810, partial [Acidimicrobiales bacterium]
MARDAARTTSDVRVGAQSTRAGSALLKWSLRGADAAALAVAWGLIQVWWPVEGSTTGLTVGLLGFVALGCWLIGKQRLYLARVATMRTVEQAGLARACAVLMAAAVTVDLLRDVDVHPGRIAAGGALTFVCLSAARTSYRGWLKAARRSGRFTRPVLIVGIDEQTAEVCAVMTDHPELGFEPVGVLGAHEDAQAAQLGSLWLGDLDQLSAVVGEGVVTGAIVSSTAIEPATLNTVTRTLLEQRCHVHLSTGITGIDQRRIRSMHLGYEPL